MADEENKQYSLSKEDSGFLRYIYSQQQAIFSALLSKIVTEKLSVKITQHTKFELNPDMDKITITEEAPEEAIKAAE